MSYVSFADLPNDQTLSTEVCIVGSGAAGIALARELIGCNHEVLVIESGGNYPSDAVQSLYDCDISGLPYRGHQEGRARIHGGTTTRWAGQASRWEPVDFTHRPWVPHSGWPFQREQIDPYYARAERLLGIETRRYDQSDWPNAVAPPPYDQSGLRFTYSQFSPNRDFAVAYGPQLRAAHNVRVLLHANAVAVETNKDGSRVENVALKSLDGKLGRVQAKIVILCLGGIETARLMLASDGGDPRGIGNHHDLVGRFYQDHIHGLVAVIHPSDRKTFHRQFDATYHGRIKMCPKVATTEDLQKREAILHVAGDAVYLTPCNSPVEAAKTLLRMTRRLEPFSKVPRSVWHILRRPHELIGAALAYGMFGQTVSSKRGPIHLGIQAESAPNPASRITLSSARDALGMQKAIIDWRLTELERRSIRVFVQTVAHEFQRLGIARVEPVESAFEGLPKSLGACHDANHHMGATRMHVDPKQGVVNADCRVHGVANLYIGSASVFPTGSFSNPTLLVLALCCRIADHIKDLLLKGSI